MKNAETKISFHCNRKKKKKIRKEVYVGFSGKAFEKKRTKD